MAKRSAKQKAATKKMRAALAAKQGKRPSKRKASKKASKKRSKKRTVTSRTTTVTTAQLSALAAGISASPRTKSRKGKKARKKPRKKSSSKRRSTSRSSAKIVRQQRAQVIVVAPPRSTPARRCSTKKRAKRRLSNNPMPQMPMALDTIGLFDNPMLFENAAGPFSSSTLKALGLVSVGVGFGFTVAELTDRFVATRGNTEPWYGRDAAAYQQSKPDAMRLGVQAGGAVLGIAATYFTRGRGPLPFLLGGITIGFGGNLVRLGLNYYIGPMILKITAPGDKTLANRLFPLEQESVQEKVTAYLEAKNKAQTGPQTPVSPLSNLALAPGEGPVYLGKGSPGPKAREASSSNGNGATAAARIVPTGRLGSCSSCGGSGGCRSSCSSLKLCPECTDEPTAMRCEYVVQSGDDLNAMAAAAQVDVNQIAALNDGDFWQPGNTVTMPYAMCMYLAHGTVYGVNGLGQPSKRVGFGEGLDPEIAALLYRNDVD